MKPPIAISGISLNGVFETPGTNVTLKNPVNACYGMLGPDADPPMLQAFFFVHAVKIPQSAPTTVALTTPFGSVFDTSPSDSGPFSKILFSDKGHAGAVEGGPDGDFYKFVDAGTGGGVYNGRYTATVTAKVGGRTLKAFGAITVNCVT